MELQSDNTMAVDNAPEVTSATQFQKRGFSPALSDDETIDTETPSPEVEAPDYSMQDPSGEETGEEPIETAPETSVQGKIRIGDKYFQNQTEAFDYAAELEREKLAADAFRQGIETARAQSQGNISAEKPAADNFEEEFYSNPKEYLAKKEVQIVQQAEQRVTERLERERKHTETWTEFYSTYPDLANSKVLVNAVLQARWNDLQHIDTVKALKILAEQVRAEKRAMLAEELPRTALPPQKRTASTGTSANVTQKIVDEKPLNFAAQIRNNKLRRA